MNRFPHRAILLFMALGTAACASTAQDGPDASSSARVYVNVDSSARAELDVSLHSGGQVLRLGRVQMGDHQRFRVPAPVLRDAPYSFAIRLVARDGTGDFTTPALIVNEGQNVFIDASLTLSSSRFSVR
jgi:hypothetical protein